MPNGIDAPSRLPPTAPAPKPGERIDPQRRRDERKHERREKRAPAPAQPEQEREPAPPDEHPDGRGTHIDIVA
jgi:hypothetical protein